MSRWHNGNSQWERVRRQVLVAANWRCRLCGSYANEVDHVKPVSVGGSEYNKGNLQAICRGCHIAKTRDENARVEVPGSKDWDVVVKQLVNS